MQLYNISLFSFLYKNDSTGMVTIERPMVGSGEEELERRQKTVVPV